MAKPGRPKKVRYIQQMPKVTQFSPRGRKGWPNEVVLSFDEFESLKLADYQCFHQNEGALAMRVSRATFGRILKQARHKIADALVNGKAIRIEMGEAQIGIRKMSFSRDDIMKLAERIHSFDIRDFIKQTKKK